MILDRVVPGDIEEILAIHNDAFLQDARMGYRGIVTRASAQRWIAERVDATDASLTLCVRKEAGGACRGYVSLARVDAKSGTAELGIVLNERGTGLGGQVLHTILHVSRFQLGLHQILVRVGGHNPGGLRFFCRYGFVEVGRLPAWWRSGTSRHDVHLLAKDLCSLQRGSGEPVEDLTKG